MAYRDDPGMARRARQVEALTRRDLDEESLHAIETDLAIADRARRADARRHLPLVAQARIASPCPEIWEAMEGEGAIRACARCDQEVFDLGAMTLAQADALIRSRVGQGTCVRLRQRTDGTMMFSDCEVGASGVRARRIGVALASLAIGASAIASGVALDTPPWRAARGSSLIATGDARPDLVELQTMGRMASIPAFEAVASSPPLGAPGYILTSPPRGESAR